MVATAVDLSNLPPLVAPPGTSIAIHQATVLGHLLTQPSTSELAQVISYEAYAPPPQPLPAPTEKTAPSVVGSSSSQAGAAAGGSTGYMANYVRGPKLRCACSHGLKSPYVNEPSLKFGII